MENEHVLAGVIRKRAEIAGRLEHAQTTVRQLIIDVNNVDATIRLFAPDMDLEEIRPNPIPPRHTAFHGEIYRLILNCLRETEMALTTKDLTLRVMADRGLNIADPRLSRTVQKRVGASLRNMRARGRVVSLAGKGSNLTWGLAHRLTTRGGMSVADASPSIKYEAVAVCAFFLRAADPDELLSVLAQIDIRVPPLTRGPRSSDMQPRRGRRETSHTEWWMICRLLATLAHLTDLSFPLRVLHRDKPDFAVDTPSDRIGVEATEAQNPQYAQFRAIAETEFPGSNLEPGHFRWGSPQMTTKRMREILQKGNLAATPWVGDESEEEWAAWINASFRRKLDTLQRPDFKKYERNWLIVYDNLPLPAIDLARGVGKLRALLRDGWDKETTFDILLVESGQTLIRLTSGSADLLPLNNLWPPRPSV